MEINIKQGIINAHTNNRWYPKGAERLKKSVIYHGWPHEFRSYVGWPIKAYDQNFPYTIKASALEYAVHKEGFEVVLWADCSTWFIKPPQEIFDLTADRGVFLFRSGFSVGQTASQKCLDYFGISREHAFEIDDCYSAVMGIDYRQPETGKKFLDEFIKAARRGIFHGSRDATPEGSPERKAGQLYWHRQDQSVASCLAYKLGIQLTDRQYVRPYEKDMPESVIMTMQGL